MRIGTFFAGVATLVLSLLTALILWEMIRTERRHAIESKSAAASMVTGLFAASVSPALVFDDVDAINTELTNLRQTEDVIGAEVRPANKRGALGAFGEAVNKGAPTPLEVRADRVVVTREVRDRENKVVGEVRVAFSLEREQAALVATTRELALRGLGILAFTTALLLVVTQRRLVLPLKKLGEVAGRIRSGDLKARAGRGGGFEIEALAGAFNAMGEALAERDRLLRTELEVAANLQVSILPKEAAVAGLETSATMRPATEVGGDYYDLVPVPGGCWIGIGDVSGHGLGSGVVMLMIQSAIAALVRARPDASPADVECTVNEVLFENIRVRMGRRDHATLTILRYDHDGTVRFAGAHEDMLVYRAATNDVEIVETPGTWVGAVRDIRRSTTESRMHLGQGDFLVLYTDGVTEAMRHGDRKQFGLDRLVEVVRTSARGSANDVRNAIADAVNDWSHAVADDISVVVLRPVDASAQAGADDAVPPSEAP